MIVLPGGGKFAIKTPKEIPVDWMQVLIDSEIGFANFAIGMHWRCIPCMKAGDTAGAMCVGDMTDNPDGSSLFLITCGCTTRSSLGKFTVPDEPSMPNERELLEPKRREHLPYKFIALMDSMERVLKLLELQFLMRCLRCQIAGRNDGIYGSRESTATKLVIECACVRREYLGPTLSTSH